MHLSKHNCVVVFFLLQQRMAVKSSQSWLQRVKDPTHLDRFRTQIQRLLEMDLLALSTRLSCVRVVTSLPSRRSCRTSASRFSLLFSSSLNNIDITLGIIRRHCCCDRCYRSMGMTEVTTDTTDCNDRLYVEVSGIANYAE